MDKEMKLMFNAVLEEIARVEEKLEKKIDKLEEKMDERFQKVYHDMELLYHEVNACKLEKDTISILMRRMDQYENCYEGQAAGMIKK